jgi:hypothetical protein
VPVADVTRTVDTLDGYHLSASLTDMTINSVPNVAATTFSREAYLSATATETIWGSNEPVTAWQARTVIHGWLPDRHGRGRVSQPRRPFGLSSVLSDLVGSGAPSASLLPTSSLQLMPGRIAYEMLSAKEIDRSDAENDINESGQTTFRITVTDANIKVDACGGPVSIRLVAPRMSQVP